MTINKFFSKTIKGFSFRMLIFSTKERNLLTSLIEKRPKFDDAKVTFTPEQLQLLDSQNYGEKIW